VGGFRRQTRAGSWFQAARIGDPALSVSVGHNSDFSICTRDGAQAPRPADCRARSGTRGVALVLLFSSQSACDCPESASLCKRNAADNRDQRAVVCAVVSQGGSAVCQVICWSHIYAQKPRATAMVARLPLDWLTPPRIENLTPLHQHRIEGGISSYHCNPLATTERAPASARIISTSAVNLFLCKCSRATPTAKVDPHARNTTVARQSFK
jgi:hypothetical protein